MKQLALTLVVLSIILAACGTSATPAPTQPSTAFPSTPTATVMPTPTPTSTPVPTATATPMPSIGSTWTRPADGMVMVFVPAGAFEMGSIDGMNTERVVHTVTLDALWIDLTEVTNGMYALCVQAGKCDLPSQPGRYDSATYKDYPVTYVNYDKAVAYCEWAGSASGATVRLPTEAEWEKAARGEDGRVYPWGNDPPTCDLANFTRITIVTEGDTITTKDIGCRDDTAAVGSFPAGASPYGTLDMTGNVWEWVADWYADYPASAVSNPTGASSGTYRVMRGGAWDIDAINMRSFSRFAFYASKSEGNLGFRCARPLP